MNEPIAYWDGKHFASKDKSSLADIPVYTQDQLEEARKLGMQQERALWNLTESTQEIMNTHPVKEQDTDCQYCKQGCIRCDARKQLTDEEITQVFDECYPNNADGDVVTLVDFARAILRKAQEK